MINQQISSDEPYPKSWINTNPSETHKKEYLIQSILNQQLYKYNLQSERIPGDLFSPYDLAVYDFNFKSLERGKEICRIDLENKPFNRNGYFPKEGFPPHWFCVSFLARKTEKDINLQRDVYVLFDDRKYPRIRWVHYKTIRELGIYKDRGNKSDRFYWIYPQHYSHIHSGYKDLVDWCNCLKNKEI